MATIKLLNKKNDDNTPIEIQDHRGVHFTIVEDLFIDKFARLVKPVAATVYMILCRHSGVNRDCWPSLALMVDKAGVSRSTVKRGLRTLEQHRLIRAERSQGFHPVYHLEEKKNWRLELFSYKRMGRRATKVEKAQVKVTWEGERMRSLSER